MFPVSLEGISESSDLNEGGGNDRMCRIPAGWGKGARAPESHAADKINKKSIRTV
jgi:hypothetical protein